MIRTFLLLLATSTLSVHASEFYVSPNGSDDASGSMEEPLATLAGARDAVRQIIAVDGGILKEDVTVYFRAGTYHFDETVIFGLEDSGSAIADITYSAYAKERPVFSGGVSIKGGHSLLNKDNKK